MIRQLHKETDRGMSIALTHVLTIGITTILIAMLLMAGSTMLETETDRSTRTSLETVGERLAGEIDNVDRIANDSDTNDATIIADHPRRVANSQYSIELLEESECGERAPLLDGKTHCLELVAQNTDVTVYVPVAIDAKLSNNTTARGGPIEVRYDSDGIGITEADR